MFGVDPEGKLRLAQGDPASAIKIQGKQLRKPKFVEEPDVQTLAPSKSAKSLDEQMGDILGEKPAPVKPKKKPFKPPAQPVPKVETIEIKTTDVEGKAPKSDLQPSVRMDKEQSANAIKSVRTAVDAAIKKNIVSGTPVEGAPAMVRFRIAGAGEFDIHIAALERFRALLKGADKPGY